MLDASTVKRLAVDTGFDLVGITTPEVITDARERYYVWLEHEYHGEMDYLAKEPDRRCDPSRILPDVKSVIMLGLNYYQPNAPTTPDQHGRISRYARGRDYHKVIASRVKQLVRSLESRDDLPDFAQFRWFVDFGPFLERPYAEKAGLGFIGKNGMLINKRFGSWIFLSEILTTLELEPDKRDPFSHGHCATCRLCMDACPTGAIVHPRTIDSRRCISYLTIERPSTIPDFLADKMGDLMFGCDICQEVCPYNQDPIRTTHADFLPPNGVGEFLDTRKVLALESREEFLKLTAGTPLTRPKEEGLKRNAEIVKRNGGTK
ncbi:MAG: tRNA epoxyqueuosine(34) reductase QueG [Candidatus Zixiibacteriota bacterium]